MSAEFINDIPIYIRRTVFFARSFCIWGASSIAIAFIIFRLSPFIFTNSLTDLQHSFLYSVATFMLVPANAATHVSCIVSKELCLIDAFKADAIAGLFGLFVTFVSLYFFQRSYDKQRKKLKEVCNKLKK